MEEMDAETLEGLDMYFTQTDAEGKDCEIKKGGLHRRVTAKNVQEYAWLVAKWVCHSSVEEEIREIRNGINLIFSSTKFANFSCEEFNRILSGDDKIDRVFLKAKLYFYNEVGDPLRNYLKQWIDQAEDDELHNFLQLITGKPADRL